MQSDSSFLRINWRDIYKGIRGALVVFIGAFLVGGVDEMRRLIASGDIDLGSLQVVQPVLVSLASFVVEEIRRLLTNYRKQAHVTNGQRSECPV